MARRVTVIVEGREYRVEVGDLGERPIKATVNQKTYYVYMSGKDGRASEVVKAADSGARRPETGKPREEGYAVTAPMPGDIAEIRVKVGDQVAAGAVVCVLEAMKMKNLIHTPHAGVVASVEVEVGQAVDFGEILVAFTEPDERR